MKTFCISLLSLLSLTTTQAFEFDTSLGSPITWGSTSMQMRGSTTTFPSGSSARDALAQAIDAWNDNPSNFGFTSTFESGVGYPNTQNEIWATTSDYWLDGAPAATWSWNLGSSIAEADIMVDADKSWDLSTTASATLAYGGLRSLQTVLLHELGHALGLQHENDEYNIMGDDSTHLQVNSTTVHFYPGEDACDGVVSLYGLDATHRQDVSVTHWKWSGRDGEYSTHTRTVIKNSSGSTLAVHSGTSDDPVYEVSLGQVIQVEYTLENSGASSQSPSTRFCISTNNNISTADTPVLATITPTINRNSVFTPTQTLTVPSTLTRSRTYYVGIIVDDTSSISEVREDNNATYIGIYIK